MARGKRQLTVQDGGGSSRFAACIEKSSF